MDLSSEKNDKGFMALLKSNNYESWTIDVLNALMAQYGTCYQEIVTGSTPNFGYPSLFLRDADGNDTSTFNPLYADPTSGQKFYEKAVTKSVDAQYKHEQESKMAVWSMFRKYTSIPVWNKVMMDSGYNLSLKRTDYLWLWNTLKQVATGEGAHSM